MSKDKKHKKQKVKLTTYGEFLTLYPCCREAHQEELMETLKKAKKPMFLKGEEVMDSLNTITYGQLDDLSRIGENEDPAVRVFKILLDMSAPEVYMLNVFDVFGFLNFAREELERINNLFASIETSHTPEEISAGVEDLHFGTFGVIDWYAKRMGITNQDEVYDVAWIRIYTCMKNDNEQTEYEKRLNKQYINKYKHHK